MPRGARSARAPAADDLRRDRRRPDRRRDWPAPSPSWPRRRSPRDFRTIDPAMSRIILIEAGPRMLPSFPRTSFGGGAARAREARRRSAARPAPVTRCDEAGVMLGAERASTAAHDRSGPPASRRRPRRNGSAPTHDRAGRVTVGADLILPGHPRIFVIGDTARALDRSGQAAARRRAGRQAAGRDMSRG